MERERVARRSSVEGRGKGRGEAGGHPPPPEAEIPGAGLGRRGGHPGGPDRTDRTLPMARRRRHLLHDGGFPEIRAGSRSRVMAWTYRAEYPLGLRGGRVTRTYSGFRAFLAIAF